jgi:hypothetical protein
MLCFPERVIFPNLQVKLFQQILSVNGQEQRHSLIFNNIIRNEMKFSFSRQ